MIVEVWALLDDSSNSLDIWVSVYFGPSKRAAGYNVQANMPHPKHVADEV